jgi:hypothetical protein
MGHLDSGPRGVRSCQLPCRYRTSCGFGTLWISPASPPMASRRLVVWISAGILGFQGATLAFDLLHCTVLTWLFVRQHGMGSWHQGSDRRRVRSGQRKALRLRSVPPRACNLARGVEQGLGGQSLGALSPREGAARRHPLSSRSSPRLPSLRSRGQTQLVLSRPPRGRRRWWETLIPPAFSASSPAPASMTPSARGSRSSLAWPWGVRLGVVAARTMVNPDASGSPPELPGIADD